jgi:hypothetical protein
MSNVVPASELTDIVPVDVVGAEKVRVVVV